MLQGAIYIETNELGMESIWASSVDSLKPGDTVVVRRSKDPKDRFKYFALKV